MKDSNGVDLDLKKALEYAKNWRNSKDFDHTALNGFHIATLDLNTLMSEAKNGIRVYMGLDENNNPKLILVGTFWNDKTETYDDMLPLLSDNPGKVYDFSMPCPKACSSVSPFNEL